MCYCYKCYLCIRIENDVWVDGSVIVKLILIEYQNDFKYVDIKIVMGMKDYVINSNYEVYFYYLYLVWSCGMWFFLISIVILG